MANLIRRAAEELKKKNAQLQAIRANKKEEEAELIGNVAALGGAAGAALIDKKWGENGEQAQLFDFIPVNATVGLGLAGTAIAWRKMPLRKPLGMLGLGLACAAAYRYTYDNVDLSGQ